MTEAKTESKTSSASSANSNPFSSFMKKKIGEKSNKIATEKKSQTSLKDPEEMTEEEEVENAKNDSKGKAKKRDNTEMIKKLILQNIVRYVAITAFLVIMAFAIIEIFPAMLEYFHGLLYRVLMGSLKH